MEKVLRFFGKKWQTAIALVILALVAGTTLFFHLGKDSLQNWDEGIYYRIYQEAAASPQMTLTLRGEPWFEKPPLGYWLGGVSWHFLGSSEFAIRFIPGVFSFCSVFLLFFLGKKLWNVRVGFLAGLFLAVTPAFLSDHMSRSGDLEGGYLFFFLLSLLAFVHSWDRPRWFPLVGAAIGLTFMYRGTSAIFLFLIVGATVLFTHLRKRFSWKQWLAMLGAFLVVVLPWHLQQWAQHGRAFTDIYFGQQFLSRIVEPNANHGYTIDYYRHFLHWKMGLFFPLGALAAGVVLFKKEFRQQPRFFLATAWMLVIFFLISVMSTRLFWYAIPLIPVFLLLPIALIDTFVSEQRSRWLAGASIVIGALFLFDPKTNMLNWSFGLRMGSLLLLVFLVLLVARVLRTRGHYHRGIIPAMFLVGTSVWLFGTYLVFDAPMLRPSHTDAIQIVATYLAEQTHGQQTDIAVFDSENWMRGWLLPAADYYLVFRHPEFHIENFGGENIEEVMKTKAHWLLTSTKHIPAFEATARAQGRAIETREIFADHAVLYLK